MNEMTNKAQLSPTDAKTLELLIEQEKNKPNNSSVQKMTLYLYDEYKKGAILKKSDLSFLKDVIKMYRLEQSRLRRERKIKERVQAENAKERKRLNHMKYLIGGFVISHAHTIDKYPRLLELLAHALDCHVSKDVILDKFYGTGGNVFYINSYGAQYFIGEDSECKWFYRHDIINYTENETENETEIVKGERFYLPLSINNELAKKFQR